MVFNPTLQPISTVVSLPVKAQRVSKISKRICSCAVLTQSKRCHAGRKESGCILSLVVCCLRSPTDLLFCGADTVVFCLGSSTTPG